MVQITSLLSEAVSNMMDKLNVRRVRKTLKKRNYLDFEFEQTDMLRVSGLTIYSNYIIKIPLKAKRTNIQFFSYFKHNNFYVKPKQNLVCDCVTHAT